MAFETKDEALMALEIARSEWLAKARLCARQIARSGIPITVNDVRKVAPELPDNVDPRVYGALFNTPDWQCLGYVKSARRVSHGRPVAQFRLVA